ncbi:MAG: chromate resistance protein [Acidobacteriia bacterium]|nr:chromate resistance protein [Terriglobia bacterium]
MRWLFLVHQIPPQPSQARVKTWRALKKMGAVLHRNSVYVLPYSKDQHEDFEWLSQQIRDSGGEASVFLSEALSEQENHELVRQFQTARVADYADLLRQSGILGQKLDASRDRAHLSPQRMKKMLSGWDDLKSSLERIRRVDFFHSNRARVVEEQVARLGRQLQALRSPTPEGSPPPLSSGRCSPKQFHGKTWVTRRDLHIDRLASAWLIRRFIDPKAKIKFAPEGRIPRGPIPFDCFGAEFSHHGEDCTFETFIKRFQLHSDSALADIAEIVHDVDLKDEKFGRAEATGFDLVIQSLCSPVIDDSKRLEEGLRLFNQLYEYLKQKHKSKGGHVPGRVNHPSSGRVPK